MMLLVSTLLRLRLLERVLFLGMLRCFSLGNLLVLAMMELANRQRLERTGTHPSASQWLNLSLTHSTAVGVSRQRLVSSNLLGLLSIFRIFVIFILGLCLLFHRSSHVMINASVI